MTLLEHAPRPALRARWDGKGIKVGTHLWLWHCWEPTDLYPFRVRVQEVVRFRDGGARAWCAVDHPTTYGHTEKYLVNLETGRASGSERAFRTDPYELHVAWHDWRDEQRQFEERAQQREQFTLAQLCAQAQAGAGSEGQGEGA